MKKIELTRNKFAIVDDKDFESLNQFNWHCTSHGYAARRMKIGKKSTIVYMHRIIMNVPQNLFIDHANMNGLDNRRINLRICTKADNQRNRNKSKTNTSGFKGVSWNSRYKKWVAYISVNDTSKNLGSFSSKKEAAEAYNTAALKYFKSYARLNTHGEPK